MREYLLTLILTAAVTYLLTPLVRRVAVATGAMHVGRERDVHTEPVPKLGGLAMYGGLAARLLIASRISPLRTIFSGSRMAAGLLIAGGLLVIVGFVDDRWGLNWVAKLAGQVAAAGVHRAGGHRHPADQRGQQVGDRRGQDQREQVLPHGMSPPQAAGRGHYARLGAGITRNFSPPGQPGRPVRAGPGTVPCSWERAYCSWAAGSPASPAAPVPAGSAAAGSAAAASVSSPAVSA